jgi:hypothetical protein
MLSPVGVGDYAVGFNIAGIGRRPDDCSSDRNRKPVGQR